MRYAEISEGRVVNVVVATPEVAAERGLMDCPAEVGPGWTYDGVSFHPPPRPAVPLDEVRAEALAAIDRQAEEARARYITPGAGQALEYQRTYEEALKASQLPDPLDETQFPMLQAELDARIAAGETTLTLRDIVDEVLTRANQWSTIGAQIKKIRREAKLKIQNAATIDEVNDMLASVVWP